MKKYIVTEYESGAVSHVNMNGQTLYYKDSGGPEYWYEWNDNGKLIYSKIKGKDKIYECWYTYDNDDNSYTFKNTDGFECYAQYDGKDIIYYCNNLGEEVYWLNRCTVTKKEFEKVYKRIYIKK